MCSACGGNSHVKIEDCAFCNPRVGKPEVESGGEKELRMWCLPDCECPECVMDRTRRDTTIVVLFVGLFAFLVLEIFGDTTKGLAQYDKHHRHNELEGATRDSHHAQASLVRQDAQHESVTSR